MSESVAIPGPSTSTSSARNGPFPIPFSPNKLATMEDPLPCYLLKLSDEIILQIYSYLTTGERMDLSSTCSRLHRLLFERKQFIRIVDPRDTHDSLQTVFTSLLHPQTKELVLSSVNYPNQKSKRYSGSSLSPSLILTPNLNNLTKLGLIKQDLDGRLFNNITQLPPGLKSLSLSGTYLRNVTEETGWFKNMCTHFPNLEELDLSFCSWITSHALMAISKAKLSKLNFEGCRGIGGSIAYTALSCRYGFRDLKVLNVNNTSVRNADFESFCHITTLEEFYFGQYDEICMNTTYDGLIRDDTIVNRLTDLKNLRVVDMSGSTASGDTFHKICISFIVCSLKNLVRVEAHCIEEFDPNILRTLKDCRPEVTINHIPLPSKSLANLGSFPE